MNIATIIVIAIVVLISLLVGYSLGILRDRNE
jgi:hypothetical protein